MPPHAAAALTNKHFHCIINKCSAIFFYTELCRTWSSIEGRSFGRDERGLSSPAIHKLMLGRSGICLLVQRAMKLHRRDAIRKGRGFFALRRLQGWSRVSLLRVSSFRGRERRALSLDVLFTSSRSADEPKCPCEADPSSGALPRVSRSRSPSRVERARAAQRALRE